MIRRAGLLCLLGSIACSCNGSPSAPLPAVTGQPSAGQPPAARRAPSAEGLNRSDGADEWGAHAIFAAPLLGNAGQVTCARLRVERGAGALHHLIWPAAGGAAERRYPFELRDGTLRFTDPEKGLVEDWLIGTNERAGGAVYVAGVPWIPGDLECSGVPALQPLPRPWSEGGPTEAEIADTEARRRFVVHDDRGMYLREPDVAGRPAGRCVRAGFHASTPPLRPRVSAALRIQAVEGEVFYFIREYARQGRAFVSAAEDVSGESGLLPTGLLQLRRDAVGWRLGDATLYFDERACEAERAHKAYPEANPTFRRGIFAAWMAFVRDHRELFWVDPSGEACERVEMSSPEGSPFVATWRWTPRGARESATYHVTVDGDGVRLRLEPSCVDHRELRGLETHGQGLRIGGSTVFDSLAACEREREHTIPFPQRCPGLAMSARPKPIPAGSNPTEKACRTAQKR